jgi:hypothetical protein
MRFHSRRANVASLLLSARVRGVALLGVHGNASISDPIGEVVRDVRVECATMIGVSDAPIQRRLANPMEG